LIKQQHNESENPFTPLYEPDDFSPMTTLAMIDELSMTLPESAMPD
jgi:hypothetical protein